MLREERGASGEERTERDEDEPARRGEQRRGARARPPRALPAPGLGQHNDYVFRRLLGLSEQEYESCRREGVID